MLYSFQAGQSRLERTSNVILLYGYLESATIAPDQVIIINEMFSMFSVLLDCYFMNGINNIIAKIEATLFPAVSL